MKMKKRICALSLLLILCVSFCVVPVRADSLWSESYYRAIDRTGELTEEQRNALDEDCLAFMRRYGVDLVLAAVTEPVSDEEAAEFYTDCEFGYGESRDGFFWLYDADSERISLLCFGAAEGRIPQEAIDALEGYPPERDVYGTLSAGIAYLESCLDAVNPSGAAAPERNTDTNLPAWYPADTENFAFFHDENAKRVVDAADIFTDAEEQAMEARIAEIRSELQRDIVIYTDVTDYGFGKDALAEDFYDYNGYGCGDESEGVCLFIDMDPADRGWWVNCTGSETMGLYTEDIANLIDDALYEYMAAGACGAGVSDWIENIRGMYVKGNPFAPDWYPAPGETLTPHYDPDAPRVVDEVSLLSETELAALTEQAASVASKWGVDVAIHIMQSPVGMSYSEVAALYYPYMGYGEDGILLTLLKRPGYLAVTRLNAFGSVADKLTETNETRMREFCEDKTDDGQYYEGLSQWLRQTDHMLRTGRVSRSALYWGVISALSLAIGSAFGGISLGAAIVKMAPPREKEDADAYIDSRSSNIREAGRHYLYTSTTRRYDPPKQKSSGGSSGGSSYRGSHSGSSGRSHSGSGRSF